MSSLKVSTAYIGSSIRRYSYTSRGPSSTRLIQKIDGDQITYITLLGSKRGQVSTVLEKSFLKWVTETLSAEKTKKAVEASALSIDLPTTEKKVNGLTITDSAKIPQLLKYTDLLLGDVVKSATTGAVLYVVACSWGPELFLVDLSGVVRQLTGDPGPFVKVKVSISVGV